MRTVEKKDFLSEPHFSGPMTAVVEKPETRDFAIIIIVNFKSCLLLLFSKSSENEESEEEKSRTSPTPIETSDDNHNVLVGPWLSVDKEMKSTEGGHRSGSPVKETTATLIVCPVSVLSTWTVSMVYLYFLCL